MNIEKLQEDRSSFLFIGGIVVWWGRIEHTLFSDLLSLQHHPEIRSSGLCRPLKVTTKALINQWSDAALVANPPTKEKVLKQITAELLATMDDRHLVIHCFRDYPSPHNIVPSRITTMKLKKGNIIVKQHELGEQRLLEIYERCFQLYHNLIPITLSHALMTSRWIKDRSFEVVVSGSRPE